MLLGLEEVHGKRAVVQAWPSRDLCLQTSRAVSLFAIDGMMAFGRDVFRIVQDS